MLPDTKENLLLKIHLAVEFKAQASASTALARFLALGPYPTEFTTVLGLLKSKLGKFRLLQ